MHHTNSASLSRLTVASIIFSGMFLLTATTRAVIVAPYTPDSATLHLWHLDEVAVPSPDAAIGGTNLVSLRNGATLGDASFAGFSSSVNTLEGGQDAITAANKDALITPSTATQPGNITLPFNDPTTGAFTLEAIVWIGFDPDKNLGTTANGGNNRNSMCQIMSCESTVNGSRIFQFRIVPKGVAPSGAGNPATAPQPLLSFENIRMVSGNQPTIFAAIPTNGPDAIVSNGWYHVAVSYNGNPNTADNIKFYWTLVDSSRTSANQIAITSTQTTLNGPNPFGTANTPFVIGNLARNVTTAGGNFLGKIDEVRISKVGRAASEMLFSSVSDVVITEQPVSQTTAPGLPVSFQVATTGEGPLAFQWQHEGTNLPGATQFVYSIASAQLSDAGEYEVVISNNVNSVTSTPPATLTFTTPKNLKWIGTAETNWDFSTINWDTTSDTTADVAFTQGDTVLFNNQGNAATPINLTGLFYPGEVAVTADVDYTLTSSSGGGIAGFTGVSKTGSGTLVMDTDNSYSGPTVIQNGTVQIGTGAGRGNLGVGPVTNNSVLIINRSGALSFPNHFAGNGSFTNNGTNAVTISGTNTFSGPITLNAGTLTLANADAKGPSTEYTLRAAGNATTLAVAGGVTFGPGTTLSLLDSTASPDNRNGLTTTGGTNTFNCDIILSGDGNIQFNSGGTPSNSLFQITAPLNSPSYTGQLILRGVAPGVITSQMNLGGKVSKTDSGVWTINSTGNSWVSSDVAGGTLRMGANDAFPSSASVNITVATGVFDLAGTMQSISALTGIGIIASSSTSSDSVLTLNPPGLSLFTGSIQNSTAGGTARVGLTLAGGNLTLGGTNTYSGDTMINVGTLDLFVNGSIANSANILIASGATLNAFLRTDQTLTVNPTQTLKGDGAFNVQGNIVNNGTIELKLNKAGATLSNDSINGSTSIAFGNTLKLNVAASPGLTTADSFPLFSAGGYSGSFANFIPSTPAPGLAWDASTLAVDGILRIATSTVNETPTNIVAQVSGNQLTLSWPESHVGWRLQAQTNSLAIGISTNWVDVSGSTTTNQAAFTLGSTNGAVFFRMIYP